MTIPAADIQYVPDDNIPTPAEFVYIAGSTEPESIHVDQVRAAVMALGLGDDLASMRSIHVEGQTVTVVRFRQTAEGGMTTAGGEVSTITTTIGVRY